MKKFLFGLGALLLVAGLIVQLLIVPGAKQFPSDVDVERVYEGTAGVLLNAEALQTNDLANLFIRDLPITINRNVKTLETDGGSALVSDISVVNSPAGPVQTTENYWSIDRKTMLSDDTFVSDERVIDREGLVVGFPIGTEKRSYDGWNGEAAKVDTLTYVDEQERAGHDTLYFTAASGPDRITAPSALASLPPALPQATLAGIVPALGLDAAAAGQLTEVLTVLPDPVPLAYTYTYNTEYWVEPRSGVLVDYAKTESRVVGIEVGGQFVPLTEVSQTSFTQTADSVAVTAKEASDAKSDLFWQGRILPWGLIAGGVILILLAGFVAVRSRDGGEIDLATGNKL
ncbi:MAG: DUF3068 domain-containing protein [Acidimicrobiales bacterium]|nr:DUF3068 domain-containing protein [Acidimicrobiales bacterium]